MVQKADFRSPRHRERIMLFPMLEELLSPPLDVADGIELMQRTASRYAIGMGCLSEILHVASESLYSVVLSN